MTVLVTGATGSVGRLLIDTLLARGESVRAITRTPDTAALPDAVEVVGGDLSIPGGVPGAAFTGVDRAFVFPAAGVDAFVDDAVEHGVEKFVVLSSLAAAQEFPRDVGSASQVHHSAVESAVTERTDNWTILRPGTFAANLLSWAWSIRSGAPIRAPYVRSAQAPIHEADVADAAVAALTDDRWIGQAVALSGPRSLTRTQQVEALGAGLGRALTLVEISPDEFRAETAQFLDDGILRMLLDYWRDTVEVPDAVRPGVADLTGRPGRTLEQWARDHRADFGVEIRSSGIAPR
ncbi:SDR family oxidoreductase [Rhodococcus sp. NPDC003382]|uniref:SDR family oxidoreductase n=1 Tax=Rhodococcus sp. HM1 TaxID=2937759 RepID=UPI00200AD0FA|nr:NAD(P)H-binding protein [Rhodococcus sp. HM1]MCK8670752.1 NAD(P)H-binding protein [Rhodococcus sp. HM1]